MRANERTGLSPRVGLVGGEIGFRLDCFPDECMLVDEPCEQPLQQESVRPMGKGWGDLLIN